MTQRNNEKRLGLPTPGASQSVDVPPPIVAPQQQPPTDNNLSYISPTELVALPSKGVLYAEDHPLHGSSDIELREMTAKEEDILTTQSFIQKGIVFERLLQSLIVDKSIKVGDLLIGDKNALLIAARSSGYGNIYDTHVACPACGHEEDFGFDLNDCRITSPVDLETTEDEELVTYVSEGTSGRYFVTLPKSNATMEVRLMTGKEETEFAQQREMQRKKKLPESPLTDHFRKITLSVNGVTEALPIRRFIESMPASDSRFLRRIFAKITPNIEMAQEFVCPDCEYEQDLEVPLTATFFWPDA